ncbi:orotidine-5'-phosphate decarboxylase [Streptomyces sp. H34-S5]|nr:orotidine-5'-phosphate decarboxylase [Streptomyces sp. H34-S5]MCY0946693.1 orotidine-5'-phosphate decarboxylase [Streptomyces sp. H34-AA3]MCZ4081325.1 orotidine-5'-phosphate decarboxylase [Streptomyces sp. H34-S5]
MVALDSDNRRAADEVVDRPGEECRFHKVGMNTAAGPDLIEHFVAKGKEAFLDLKPFEIPNPMAGTVRAAGALGVSMVTVHSMGGTGIMSAAVAAARDFPRLRVLALTVVTSMTSSDLADIGVAGSASTEEQVLRLARLAEGAGCQGVIASPKEAGPPLGVLRTSALIVTPGVTLPGESPGEHARPGTTRGAAPGASHVVVGRTVTRTADPAAAFRLVRTDLEAVSGSDHPAGWSSRCREGPTAPSDALLSVDAGAAAGTPRERHAPTRAAGMAPGLS